MGVNFGPDNATLSVTYPKRNKNKIAGSALVCSAAGTRHKHPRLEKGFCCPMYTYNKFSYFFSLKLNPLVSHRAMLFLVTCGRIDTQDILAALMLRTCIGGHVDLVLVPSGVVVSSSCPKSNVLRDYTIKFDAVA